MNEDPNPSPTGDDTAAHARSWRLSLIQTKMTPPRPPHARVSRWTLLERLKDGCEASLTVVIAPAGFGKTTLLAEWCEHLRNEGQVAGWLSLDADDDEDQQFSSYVVAALSEQAPHMGWQAEALLRNDPLTPVRTVMSVLLNDIASCDREVYLVLDDFDRLTSRAVRAVAYRLLRYAPPNFHVLLGVRGEPDLPLGQLRTQRQLLRFDAEDLRFTSDDAQAFLKQTVGVELDHASMDLLHGATEGWIAGLQLAALSVRENRDAPRVAQELASQRFGIDSYLEESVLQPLPQAMVQFLLKTSILERLNPRLCDAVLGEKDTSWERLNWLDRRNVFIRALDDDRQWFRIHGLMLDVLRRRAKFQISRQLPELHRRASEWFAAEQHWHEAVRHAIAAGRMQEAATYVEHCAMTLLDRSDARTLLTWIARLPPDLVQQRARLRLDMAWGQVLSRDAEHGRETVDQLMADLGRRRESTGRTDEDEIALAGELFAVRGLIEAAIGDSSHAVELGRAAIQRTTSSPAWAQEFAECALTFGLAHAARFEEVRAIERQHPIVKPPTNRPIFPEVHRTCMFGLNAMLEGRLSRATEIYTAALELAEQSVGPHSAAASLPAGPLAAMLYERNELDRARQVIGDRTALVMAGASPGSLVRFCRASASLYARDGDLGSALSILEEARQLATSHRWIRLRSGCDAESIRLYLQNGRRAEAEELINDLHQWFDEPFNLAGPMSNAFESWCNYTHAKARVLVSAGRAEEAIGLLRTVRSKAAEHGMRYQEAQTAILMALAYQASARRDLAQEAIGSALRFGAAEEMVSAFVDERDAARDVLSQWRPQAGDATAIASFVARLVVLCESQPAPAPPPHEGAAAAGSASGLLRAREVEILMHISRGQSNKEIARALGVAPETVKWHLKNIFEKLDVSSRVEAVQAGLGLTPAPPRPRR